MAENEFAEFKDLFVSTARENLQLLTDSLLAIEKDATDTQAVLDIFRAAHSMKGECAAMGYQQTAYLCHAIEDVFAEVKAGRATVSHELADLLLTAFDALAASVTSIEQQDAEATNLAETIDALKRLTGVTTTGGGKTIQAAPDPAPEKVDTPPPILDAPATQTAPATPPQATIALTIKTIPIKVEQLDTIMNLIEELIVDRLGLKQLVQDLNNELLRDHYDKTERTINSLEFEIMKIRAVPIKMIFDHLPRAVRDLARIVNKTIDLVIEGGDLELDRTIVERLDEPLIHLIRNAADHGLEKSGTIRISAKREKDYAVIEVADNGAGVDWQALAKKANVETADPAKLKELLFSGISTAEKVTQISGRGVGLGAVRHIVEEMGGQIDVLSELGKGTTFRIKLPMTLAIIEALVVVVGTQRYVIADSSVDRSIKLAAAEIKKSAGQEVFVLEEKEIPLLRLAQKFNNKPAVDAPRDELVVIVTADGERVGLVVDGILQTGQVIVKPVPDVIKENRDFAGVTILGDGQSVLLINPSGILHPSVEAPA